MTFFNRKSIKVIQPPVTASGVVKVISFVDMKEYLRVDTTADDTLINDFIDIATETARNYTQRAILKETIQLTLDRVSNNGGDEFDRLGAGTFNTTRQAALGWSNEIDLPFPPIIAISSIKTYATDNTESTYSSSNYQLDETGGRVYLNQGATWPSNLRAREAIKIEYTAGYGASATGVPASIRQAIRQHVAYMYECRQSCDMPPSCKDLLAPYKLYDQLGWA